MITTGTGAKRCANCESPVKYPYERYCPHCKNGRNKIKARKILDTIQRVKNR